MTTHEQLIDQGRTEGRAEGRTEGRAEALIEFLTVKFGNVNPDYRARIHDASLATLTEWTTRIFAADTIDDVFA